MSRTNASNLSKTAGRRTFFEPEGLAGGGGGGGFEPPPPLLPGGKELTSFVLPEVVVEAKETMDAHGFAGGVTADASTSAVLVFAVPDV